MGYTVNINDLSLDFARDFTDIKEAAEAESELYLVADKSEVVAAFRAEIEPLYEKSSDSDDITVAWNAQFEADFGGDTIAWAKAHGIEILNA